MPTRYDLDREGSLKANSARAVVASLCVLGLATLVWMRIGAIGEFAETPAAGIASSVHTADVRPGDYLHAPTSDPSLPSLDATFSAKDVTPADEAPAPTF